MRTTPPAYTPLTCFYRIVDDAHMNRTISSLQKLIRLQHTLFKGIGKAGMGAWSLRLRRLPNFQSKSTRIKTYFLLDARKDLTTDLLKRLISVVRFFFADPTADFIRLSPESIATFPIPTMY